MNPDYPPDTPEITLAVVSGNYEKVLNMLKNRVDPNSHTETFFRPLNFAAMQGNVKIAKLLIDYGADVDYVDDNGEIPLEYALGGKSPYKMVSLLLDHGAGETLDQNNLPESYKELWFDIISRYTDVKYGFPERHRQKQQYRQKVAKHSKVSKLPKDIEYMLYEYY